MSKTNHYGSKNIKWDLSDLFTGIKDPQINKILTNAKKNALNFETTYKGKLAKLTTKELLSAYKKLEDCLTPLYKLSQYASLVYSTDTANDDTKALVAKVDNMETEISNHIVFFDLELGSFTAKKIKEIESDKDFKNYKYSFQHTIKTAQYNLSESEEKIISLKNLTGKTVLKKLYEEISSSFQFTFTVDGEEKHLNGSQLRALRQHEDPEVRRNAMRLFFKKYEENEILFTNLYNALVKDMAVQRELRGYKTAISARNIGNDLPDSMINMLHEVTTESNSLVQRYYKLKKKLLHLPKMTLADIYAPMPESTKTYEWKDAKELVLKGLSNFDSEFYSYAQIMFNENRIDAPTSPTKRGGAFCSSSTPDVKPYILLNFLGRPRDVATLAHEMGHAIHDIFSEKQTLTNYHPVLPMAETASIFSEMIITDLLLKEETDKSSKIALLTDKLEDIFASSHRQNMFSRFEMESHRKIAKTQLSSSELCHLYKNELKLMFGNSVTYTNEYNWEWASIPHIFEWPFYVYAYNFGNLLVLSLYQQYKTEGSSFIPKIKNILSAGSSASPKDITKLAGIDITKKAFWQQSIDVIDKMLKDLESLVEQ